MKKIFFILLLSIFLIWCSKDKKIEEKTENWTSKIEVTNSWNTEKISKNEEKVDLKSLRIELSNCGNYLNNNFDLYYNYEKFLEKVNPEKIEIYSCYIKYENKIFQYWEKIAEIDEKTFEILTKEDYLSTFTFKDKNFVYFEWKKQENIDVKTFEKIDKLFYKDKNWVYKDYRAFTEKSELLKINWIDKDSFEFVWWFWEDIYKDKNGIFIEDNKRDENWTITEINLKKIENIDFASFEKLNENYSKDKNGIYSFDNDGFKKIEWIDLNSYKIIWKFLLDKENVFIWDKKSVSFKVSDFTEENIKFLKEKNENDLFFIEYNEDLKNIYKNIDKITFKALNQYSRNQDFYWSKDKNWVYLYNYKNLKKIEGADPESIELYFKNYQIVKDKNFEYDFETGEKIKDLKTNKYFELKWENKYKSLEPIWKDYYRDENFIYYGYDAEKLENNDLKTFEIIGENLTKDKNWIYYKNKKIDADKDSFEYINSTISKDKNFIYFINRETINREANLTKIENIDIKTFEKLNDEYFKDKNNIYAIDWYNSKFFKIEWVDYNSFKIINLGYAKDKNNFYYYWEIIKDEKELEELKKEGN